MNAEQTRAFKAAAGNVEPGTVNTLFIGVLIVVLTLWAGWALVQVYRGYAAGTITLAAVQRTVIRIVLLLLISLYLFAS